MKHSSLFFKSYFLEPIKNETTLSKTWMWFFFSEIRKRQKKITCRSLLYVWAKSWNSSVQVPAEFHWRSDRIKSYHQTCNLILWFCWTVSTLLTWSWPSPRRFDWPSATRGSFCPCSMEVAHWFSEALAPTGPLVYTWEREKKMEEDKNSERRFRKRKFRIQKTEICWY